MEYIFLSAVKQENFQKSCNILVDQGKKKCGKVVIWLQTTKSLLLAFNNSLRQQMSFVLFDKWHFYLLYQFRSLVFRLIISWNFSLPSIYYSSSECAGAVCAEQGPSSLGTNALFVGTIYPSITRQRQKLQSQDFRLPCATSIRMNRL